jgi:ABC-type nitrate/sulfonate/bicarbonate transport system substrate-binding protein
MIPASIAGLKHYDEPLVALMMLSAGGNAITVAAPLAALGTGPAAPALWRRHLGRVINLAHVFPGTSHHLAIREFIEASGLQIGRDVNLCVMPPAQTPSLLRSGIIDGYCAGEPWNTLATTSGVGTIIRAGTEIFPNHPEKALAVTRTWHEQNPHAAERLIQATLRGCDFCENPANHSRLSKLLAAPAYLGLDEDVIARSLSIDSWLRVGIGRPRFRSFARAATVPHAASVEWIVRQMMRWDELPKTSDVEGIAAESVAIDTYIRATAEPKPTKRITQEQIA